MALVRATAGEGHITVGAWHGVAEETSAKRECKFDEYWHGWHHDKPCSELRFIHSTASSAALYGNFNHVLFIDKCAKLIILMPQNLRSTFIRSQSVSINGSIKLIVKKRRDKRNERVECNRYTRPNPFACGPLQSYLIGFAAKMCLAFANSYHLRTHSHKKTLAGKFDTPNSTYNLAASERTRTRGCCTIQLQKPMPFSIWANWYLFISKILLREKWNTGIMTTRQIWHIKAGAHLSNPIGQACEIGWITKEKICQK